MNLRGRPRGKAARGSHGIGVHQDALAAGYDAQRRGDRLSANPFSASRDARRHNEWKQGWLTAVQYTHICVSL